MFKAFTLGFVGIIFSTSMGILAATTAVNANTPVDATTFTAQYAN